MLALRYARYWKAIGGLLVIATLVGALLPPVEGPDGWLHTNDKLMHGTVFFLLTIWFCGQFERKEYWILCADLLAFGAVIEIFQLLTSYRKADLMDFVADGVGIGAGLAAVMVLGLGGWSVKLERKLAK